MLRFDEVATAGPEHLDPAYVAAYDRKAGTDPSSDVEALRGARTVLDLGAGTGTFALAMAPHVERLVAVDVSPAMVAHLRSVAPPNVEVVRAGFLSYEGGPFDAVYSRHALHSLPDFWKAVALSRIAGMLRPGGTFLLRDLVYDFEPHEAGEALDAWFAGATDDLTAGWTSDELAEHVRTEFSTFSWLLRPMLEHAGFDVVEVEHHRRAYGRYLCTLRA